MKKKFLLFLFASLILGAQMARAQYFEYKREKIDNRQFEDVCIEYVRDLFNVGNKKITILGMTHYPLPNGNTFVFLRFKWDGITYYEEHKVPGSLVWSSNKTETIYQRHQLEEARRCAVVVNPNGFVNSWFKIPENFSIWKVKDNAICFLMDRSSVKVGESTETFYNYINCLDCYGNLLWEGDKDFMAFSFIKTENNIYLAGEKVGDIARSLVRGIDINTGKVVSEKVGNPGDICVMVSGGDEGLVVNEYLNKSKSYRSFTIPYEANDKEYHFRQLLSRYDQSKALDQIAIGERYLKGSGFDKNEKLAFNWFKKAADQKDSKGMERLAYCYKNGLGVEQDKAKAVSYYEESAKAGNKDAIKSAIKMYVEGDGIPNNMSRALYWQETLAFNGDIEAQKYVISHKLFEYEKANITSDEVNQLGSNAYKANNFEWAWFCFERGVSMGNEQSKYNQGLMYMEGKGVAKNYAKAIDCMSGTAEKGDVVAQYYIATMYNLGDTGNGVNRDGNKYIYWLTRAAENGHEDALYQLAQCYENGTDVKKNKKTAVEIFEKIPKKNQELKIKLFYIFAAGLGVKKDPERALYYFETLPSNIEGEIADDIFWGRDGIKKNKKLGLELYKRAAAKGNKEALKSYQLWSK